MYAFVILRIVCPSVWCSMCFWPDGGGVTLSKENHPRKALSLAYSKSGQGCQKLAYLNELTF